MKKERNGLCFGLRSEVRFLLPAAAVLRSFLCVHDAPPGADHLEREIACGGFGEGTAVAAAALRCPPPPGPEGAWEERKGDDASVLVASEELALDSAAFDVLFEPCERFGVVGLCRTTEIRSLLNGDGDSKSAKRSIAHDRGHKVIKFLFLYWEGRKGKMARKGSSLTSGASMAAMRTWIVSPCIVLDMFFWFIATGFGIVFVWMTGQVKVVAHLAG